MSDDDLLATVRTQFADVWLSADVEDVIARGRQLRSRRRMWSAVGAGTAAVAAIAVGLAAPGPGQGNGTRVELDAWSVISKPNGTVSLTIRDRRESGPELARLRKALREAGVFAVVQTALPRHCRVEVRIPPGITTSRHAGAVTFNLKPGKLPKNTPIAIVIPATLVIKGSGPSRRVEVRVPGAVRPVPAPEHAAIGRPGRLLPRIVVFAPGSLCPPAALRRARAADSGG